MLLFEVISLAVVNILSLAEAPVVQAALEFINPGKCKGNHFFSELWNALDMDICEAKWGWGGGEGGIYSQVLFSLAFLVDEGGEGWEAN